MVIIMSSIINYNIDFSGDTDGNVPITSTKDSIATMKLSVKKSWYPWFVHHEVRSCNSISLLK